MAYNRGGNGNQRNSGGQNGNRSGGNGGNRGGNRSQLNYIYAANFTHKLKFETEDAFYAWLDDQHAMLDSLQFDPKGVAVHQSFDATNEISINVANKDVDAFFADAEKAAGAQDGDGGVRLVLYVSKRENKTTGEVYDGASMVFQPKFNQQKSGGRRGSFGGGGGGQRQNGRRDYPDRGSQGNGGQEQRQSRSSGRSQRGANSDTSQDGQTNRGDQTQDSQQDGNTQNAQSNASHSDQGNQDGSYNQERW